MAGLEDGRLTVLVLGSDSSALRRARGTGGLTDAITVVSIAADGSNVALISLPRDSVDFPMPDGSTWHTKVNAITELRGVETMREAMAGVFGIQIDHYVLVDMDDFPKIVDAVGGVTVSVPYTLSDNRCTIPAGTRHLDGALALCFARNRHSDSDYARAGRHQQLLLALRDGFLDGGVDLPALVASLHSLQTDIDVSELPQYLELLQRSVDAQVHQLVLQPPTYTTFAGTTPDRGYISIPDIDAIHAAVAQLIGQ
jgi:LCP family protein required for cell wall assembly